MNKKKFAVVGHPIGHTMSPFIHARLFALSGLPAEYGALDLAPGDFAGERTAEALRRLDGFNVTIPYKRAVIPLLDGLDKKAEEFSSVNTVKNEGGALTGYTTDGDGFLKSLAGVGVSRTRKCLILGGGGVARVMAFELLNLASDITVCVREKSLAAAQELRQALAARALRDGRNVGLRVCGYGELAGESCDLLINATPVGMYPNENAMPPVPPELLKNCACVFDAIYNPADTLLLKTARENGAFTVGGMDMLVWQAAAAHAIWYGADFPPQGIRALCRDAELEMERIFGKARG